MGEHEREMLRWLSDNWGSLRELVALLPATKAHMANEKIAEVKAGQKKKAKEE